MENTRKVYVLDRDPRIAQAAEKAVAFLFNDAPGRGWNSTALAAFLQASHDQLAGRLKNAADPAMDTTTLEEAQLRSSLETLLEAKRVWQDLRAAHEDL